MKMKKTVKKQDQSRIKCEELRGKVQSIINALNDSWISAKDMNRLLVEKNVPYKSSIMKFLVKHDIFRASGSSHSIRYRVVSSSRVLSEMTIGKVLIELRSYCGAGKNINTAKEKVTPAKKAVKSADIERAVAFLKSQGYKVFLPVTKLEEV